MDVKLRRLATHFVIFAVLPVQVVRQSMALEPWSGVPAVGSITQVFMHYPFDLHRFSVFS